MQTLQPKFNFCTLKYDSFETNSTPILLVCVCMYVCVCTNNKTDKGSMVTVCVPLPSCNGKLPNTIWSRIFSNASTQDYSHLSVQPVTMTYTMFRLF